MTIRIFGDVHALYHPFAELVENTPEDYTIVQVGDFGFFPRLLKSYEVDTLYSRPVYAIDGNHEDFEFLPIDSDEETIEVVKNIFYIPRGTIMELDNRKILFLGGGESIDKDWRTPGIDWWPEESIRSKDLMKIDTDQSIDMIISHVPPLRVIDRMTGGDTPYEWNHSSRAVEGIWETFGKPPLYCGHMHQNFTSDGVVVLNELAYIDV